MKWIIIIITLFKGIDIQAAQYNIDTTGKEYVEVDFKSIIGREIFQNLQKIDLGQRSFNKMQYYSYKIINRDSIIFKCMNFQLKAVDSVVKKSFFNAVDSSIKKNYLEALINDSYTYIPLILLYKSDKNEKLNEQISIAPLEETFSWDYNTDTKKPEAIFRTFAPVICRLPVLKKYY